MENTPNILKISSHVFKMPEYQLESLLYNHFVHNQPFLKIPYIWLFIVLIVEIIIMGVFGADTFVKYKGHLFFGFLFISGFITASYTSWRVRKKRIDDFINELKALGL